MEVEICGDFITKYNSQGCRNTKIVGKHCCNVTISKHHIEGFEKFIVDDVMDIKMMIPCIKIFRIQGYHKQIQKTYIRRVYVIKNYLGFTFQYRSRSNFMMTLCNIDHYS
jgi:hypothetical protein